MKINVSKDSIEINEGILKVTTTLNDLCTILGVYDKQKNWDKLCVEYVWNKLGIKANISKNNELSSMIFYLKGCNFKHTDECFYGDILADGKKFKENDSYE